MSYEMIVASRYILTKSEEVGSFVCVAYKLAGGEVRNEILMGHNKSVSVQMVGGVDENVLFGVYHVFVERYIKKCLDRTIDNVEIFRFHLSRGDYPTQPSDIRGELLSSFIDSQGNNVWTSYEHISGPYLADPQFVVSAFTAGRMDDIAPIITQNLILDPASYRRSPQDLPLLGVIPQMDEITADQKQMEDILIRTKTKKPSFVN